MSSFVAVAQGTTEALRDAMRCGLTRLCDSFACGAARRCPNVCSIIAALCGLANEKSPGPAEHTRQANLTVGN